MAKKKNKNGTKKYSPKKYKKYSYLDRMSYYENKANHGQTNSEQSYAYGYLDGMRGIKVHPSVSEPEKVGNKAGLSFWSKLTKTKL